ncbi:MAG: hypothetical protein Q7U12_15100 [Undibacterium sp.]|nr:hypothetical protein [Undibacterium sp.]
MTSPELAFRSSTEEACNWLAQQTGAPWTLAQLIENGLIPYIWLDYDANMAALFGEANGGYPAPIFFEGDTQRLAAGSPDVLITITKDADKIVVQLPSPGIRRALHELRFLKKDIERLAGKLKREAEPVKVQPEVAKESQQGIGKEQVLAVFGSLVKLNLEKELAGGVGIFGDDGARVKGSARKAKNKALWNPITLALGLNDVYRVPMPYLKKAFNAHDFLHEWRDEWRKSLDLLGE